MMTHAVGVHLLQPLRSTTLYAKGAGEGGGKRGTSPLRSRAVFEE